MSCQPGRQSEHLRLHLPPLSNRCYRDGAATRRGHLKSNHALRRHVQSHLARVRRRYGCLSTAASHHQASSTRPLSCWHVP
ncbi:hypothetical protein CGCF413_v012596 [Colletotrichum fructicola]|nr:hypothetical protein CFRS1_v002705 [Colletotrichum fructicola]KAF5488548.1 hypothetical protein CGCF413_v012596 [Colletotrichum fructicola]